MNVTLAPPLSPSFQQEYYLPLVNTVACSFIGFSSMFSLFIFNIFIYKHNPFAITNGSHKKTSSPVQTIDDPSKSEIFKCVLAFALGALLGDVFLHLLPEASEKMSHINAKEISKFQGIWILTGLFAFAAFESFCTMLQHKDDCVSAEDCAGEKEMVIINNVYVNRNGVRHRKNASSKSKDSVILNRDLSKDPNIAKKSNITGYLNMIANGLDNFVHGMSVGATFLVGFKTGCLTTLSIVIHEIPHEIVDNIILLRSGFSIWKAFVCQLGLSMVTIVGSLTVLYFDSPNNTLNGTLWILPTTAGGFIYIACGSLLPEVYTFEARPNYTPARRLQCLCLRLAFIVAGISTMLIVNDLIELF